MQSDCDASRTVAKSKIVCVGLPIAMQCNGVFELVTMLYAHLFACFCAANRHHTVHGLLCLCVPEPTWVWEPHRLLPVLCLPSGSSCQLYHSLAVSLTWGLLPQTITTAFRVQRERERKITML